MRHVTLVCLNCHRRYPYITKDGDGVPENCETIEQTGCAICDDGGGFVEETYLDAAGNEIEPVVPN